MEFKWQKNYACTCTFAVLRNKDMLNQKGIPTDFDAAGKTKLKDLTYYPQTSSDSTLIENQATMVANSFVAHVHELGVVKSLQDVTKTMKDIKIKLKPIFEDGEKTLTDVAAQLDKSFLFYDEN